MSTRSALAARHERGSASILMVGVMGVVVTLSCAAMVIAGHLVAFHRARAAADLTALSAAAAYEQGADPCRQARSVAVQNGGQVTTCELVGDQVDFVVTVTVTLPTRTRIAGLPTSVTADANAGPVSPVPG